MRTIPQKPFRPVVLVVLDGLGVSSISTSPLYQVKRPTISSLEKFFPFTTLQASGIAVGLPWGEEGNSEVGHLTIGSGRVIYHHLPKISVSIQDGSFFENEAFLKAAEQVVKYASALHLMGLFSSGSVHAYPDHLYALLEFAKQKGVERVFLHLFSDGRDSPREEAGTFFQELELRIAKNYPFARISSVVGRDWAMDRDGNWGKIERVYNLLVRRTGRAFQRASTYLAAQYQEGVTDEFIEPGYLEGEQGGAVGRVGNNDAVIFFNFRGDSARELSRAFVQEGFDKFPRQALQNLLFVAMTEYEEGFPFLIAFPPLGVSWPLAEVIAEANLAQLHVAETEKYAHVTYFFNGGRERPYPGEERILIPSLPGAKFDEHPEMSADKVTNTTIANFSKYDFILVNYANADMVGHTGDFDATVKALEVLDGCLGKILEKVLATEGALLITGDHGNAEEKRYPLSGEKKTKHTANAVPFYLAAKEFKRAQERSPEEIFAGYNKVEGVLTDVAPTILKLMGLPIPAEMTGVNLLARIVE